MFELPERIFIVHTTTADFHTSELNNLAASTKRGDVVLRCILSALSRTENPQDHFGIWIFFNPTERGIQRPILVDNKVDLPQEIQNEVLLCELIQPIIIISEEMQEIKRDYGDFVETRYQIKIYKKTLSEAIDMLSKSGFLFVILDEQGISHKIEEFEHISKQYKSIAFILGDQIGISQEMKEYIDINNIKPLKISLGPVSYLTSQCITILKHLFR